MPVNDRKLDVILGKANISTAMKRRLRTRHKNWFDALSPEQQKEYVAAHPNSAYA